MELTAKYRGGEIKTRLQQMLLCCSKGEMPFMTLQLTNRQSET